MAFIPYLEKPEEWDLRRIVRERQEPQNKEWIRERIREQLRKQMKEERIAEHVPPDIREAIRQLRDAGWLPAQQRDFVNGFGAWVREAFADVGFLLLFLLFVLIGSIYLGQRTMFYILSLILLSIIVVNAHKFRRLIELIT